MRAAAPALFEASRHERSVLRAAATVRSESHRPDGVRRPVFAGVRGGVGRLPLALADLLRAAGVVIETGSTVRELRRTGDGWELVVGAANAPRVVRADAVIVAVPAPAAARLLKGHCLQAETELADIGTTSVAVVTLLYRAADLPGGDLPEGSGYLVPPSEQRPVKAATFAAHKWSWLADAAAGRTLVAVRASLGHADDVETLQRDDDDLVRVAAQDLAFVARLGRATPVATRVSRWGGGLPRYAVGHVARVARITEAVDDVPGLAICGAELDGVGIPACVARADRAATRVTQRLAVDGQWRHG
jgi:oxygen-dependent protoporphyrinogen oxidase